MGKFFILNADNFGMSKEHNKAILEAYNNGFLTSTSLIANGEAFPAAVNDILPECPNLGTGIQLNITIGKSLTDCKLLTDSNGNFNTGLIYIFINSRKKDLLSQIEKEFRAQIEKVQKNTSITHLSSYSNIHMIPEIFKLVLTLAIEYKIPFIRTMQETIYFVPNLAKHLRIKYIFNFIKTLFLNHFSKLDKDLIKTTSIKTNDYIIGSEYADLMDFTTIDLGLKSIDKEELIVETIINPYYSQTLKNSHTNELALALDKKLEDSINRQGYEITNYKKLT